MERIILEDLKVKTTIGVSEKERSRRQHLWVSVEIEPVTRHAGRGDSIENTIDYSSIRRDIKEILEGGAFHLIETAAEQIALHLKSSYPVKSLIVFVKKRPYRDTRYCGYRLCM
jgi:dihydroneopterin aldolase